MTVSRYEALNQEWRKGTKKKRVAAYCRVSTDREDQAGSFENQCRYFRKYIEEHRDWELYEIFADEGITGTNTKKRGQFHRMIACAENGLFDLILTKEISRFARNTLDSIYYTRILKNCGVGVIFLNDNINTLEADAELRLAILSSIAQEESRKTSERVKWGQKRRMEQGVVFGRSLLGYDVTNGKITVNEDGAKTVRLIFYKFVAEGKGTHVIARELLEEGIMPASAKKWHSTVILRILRNEKYCGDLVQKKTYTPDFLSHEKKYNRGQEEFVILKNHHTPIISREIFEEANRRLDERATAQTGKEKYSGRYPLSGKIKCGCCQSSYVARYRLRKDSTRYKSWRCYGRVKNTSMQTDREKLSVKCSAPGIRNEDLIWVLAHLCGHLNFDRKKLKNHLSEILAAVYAADTGGEKKKKIEAVMDELLNGVQYEDEFYRHILEKITVDEKGNLTVKLKMLSGQWKYERI